MRLSPGGSVIGRPETMGSRSISAAGIRTSFAAGNPVAPVEPLDPFRPPWRLEIQWEHGAGDGGLSRPAGGSVWTFALMQE